MKNQISINCHSSIKISGDKIIYIDPYNIRIKSSDADIVFLTHDHYDHLEIESIKNVINEYTTVVTPTSVQAKSLEPAVRKDQIIGVCPSEQYFIDGVSVFTVPSYNVNKDFHKKMYNWLGYIIELNGEKIYIAGDTDVIEEMKNIKCDVAMVPIGGTYTMNYTEAAKLINYLKPKHVIPTHYGIIVGNLKDGEAFKELIDKDIECHLLIK